MTKQELESAIKDLQLNVLAIAALSKVMLKHAVARDAVGRRVAELLCEKIEDVAGRYR